MEFPGTGCCLTRVSLAAAVFFVRPTSTSKFPCSRTSGYICYATDFFCSPSSGSSRSTCANSSLQRGVDPAAMAKRRLVNAAFFPNLEERHTPNVSAGNMTH